MRLHEALVTTEIAIRYYKIKHPKRKYSRHYAIRQWKQDNNIDQHLVELIVSIVFEEQKKMFNQIIK